MHQPDAVGVLLGLFQIVRRQHDRGTLGTKRLHGVPERVPSLDVEPGGRFVQEDQLRSTEHRCSEVEATLLTAGQLRHLGVGLVGEIDDAYHPFDGVGATCEASEQPNGLRHREVAGESALLEHDAHSWSDPATVGGAATEHAHRSRRRCPVTLDHLQGGRLARSVRAEQCVQLSLLDVEGELLHGFEVAVADAQLIDIDDPFGRPVVAFAE
jgi:hypothetical protein